MKALARAAAALLPLDTPPPSAGVNRDARELLARLDVAVGLRDAAATDRLLDDLLAHEWLGRRIASRVIVQAGHYLAGPDR